MVGTRPYILWIGVIASNKNPLQIVDIAAHVPQVDFVLVGAPFDKDTVRQLETTKPPNVTYLGSVSESRKNQLIRRCSAGISTSRWETFGWVPLEFLTRKKPVLGPPLASFKEVYGDLMIYALDTEGFVSQIKRLYATGFRVEIKKDEVHQLQIKYGFKEAASAITRRLGSEFVVMFTQDAPLHSKYTAGYLRVNWRLCKELSKTVKDLVIFSDWSRFATEAHLLTRTTQLPKIVRALKARDEDLILGWNKGELHRKLIKVVLLAFEPICYVGLFLADKKIRSRPIVAVGPPQILAAITLKMLRQVRVACLLHDVLFFTDNSKYPLLFKAYNLLFSRALRHADYLITVSRAHSDQLLRFYPYPQKVVTLFGDQLNSRPS